jgi:hypothetical protein
MQGTSIDLSIETSEKCAIGSEKKTEILTAENCFRKIMDNKKGNAGKKRSPDSDEGIGSSFDSNSSSTGTKDNKERADCDFSPKKPELNNSLETETGYTKKKKESKSRMLKRMLTRPMRRHKSDDCSKHIPAHAILFIQPVGKIKNRQSLNIHKKTSLKMRTRTVRPRKSKMGNNATVKR